MGPALLSTKLHPPAPTAHVMARPRLHALLGRRPGVRLILVSAPAGAGKSTLVATWLKQHSERAAWLSLDGSDNDLGRFLRYLISALQQVEPAFGTELSERLQQPNLVNAEPLLIQLINDLAQLGNDLVLVLDDYHALSAPQIHVAVDFLLDHLPSQLRLVIITRSDPPLALSRLRVRGQLSEIRGADLRFDLSETTHFLNGCQGLGLSPDAIASVEARTEGWIAALQLVALSLVGRPDKETFVEAFAGNHRFLVDYLLDEVLSRQPPQIKTFLQRTAILERFTASLCEAVAGQPAGADLLGQLEAANLFLIPLDSERKWYRFHHLFAEFLQHRLLADEPDLFPELHRRASAWFESGGWTDDAIRHAFLAADNELAARLVEDAAAELALHWNNERLVGYFQQLPVSLLPHHPRLCIFYCWFLTTNGQLTALKAALPLLEQSRAYAQRPHAVDVAVLTLQAYERLRRMDFAGATRLCHRALGLLGPDVQGSPGVEEQWVHTAATNLRAYICLHSDPRQADALYTDSLALSQQFGSSVGVAYSSARLARTKHLLGQLHEAADIVQQGLHALGRGRGDGAKSGRAGNIGELHIGMSRLHYEWNQLGEAQAFLQRARTLNELYGPSPAVALELETSLRLCLARGDIGAAHTSLHSLDQLVAGTHRDDQLSRLTYEVMAMKGRLALAAQVPRLKHLLAEVTCWARERRLESGDRFGYPLEGSYAVLARLLAAQNKPAGALRLLERLAGCAQAEDRRDALLQYLLLQALAFQSEGQESRARQTLLRALELAEPEGYCRSFVDLGPAMRGLLRQLARSHLAPYLGTLLGAFPEQGEPSATSARSGSQAATGPASDRRLTVWNEPFNERERSVLRLLEVGSTHKQIARELQLSPNTVRWYMKTLYSKLQVSNRTEAVNRARDLGLL